MKYVAIALALSLLGCQHASALGQAEVRYVSPVGIQSAAFNLRRRILTRHTGFPNDGTSNLGEDPFGGEFPITNCDSTALACLEAAGMAFSAVSRRAVGERWQVGQNTFSVIFGSAEREYWIVRVSRVEQERFRFDYVYEPGIGVVAFILYDQDANTSAFFLDSTVGLLPGP